MENNKTTAEQPIKRSPIVKSIVDEISKGHTRPGLIITSSVLILYIIILVLFPFSKDVKINPELALNNISESNEIEIRVPSKYHSQLTRRNYIEIKYRSLNGNSYEIEQVKLSCLNDSIYILNYPERNGKLIEFVKRNEPLEIYLIVNDIGFLNFILWE